MMRINLTIVVVVSVLFATRAFGADQQTWDRCQSGGIIEVCDQILREGGLSSQNRSATYNNRGIAWGNKGDTERAIADFNEAIRLNPQNFSAYNNRGNAWKKKGDNDRAIADFNEAIRLNPNYVLAYRNRGSAWSNKGDHDRVIADLNEALRLDPNNSRHYNDRAVAWGKKGDNDRAIADYGEAIRLDPKYVLAYLNRGIAWGKKGDHDRAIADFGEAIRLDPKNSRPYNDRAVAWNKKGDNARALADYNEAIRLDPNYILAYNNRAKLKRSIKDTVGADADIAAARAIKTAAANTPVAPTEPNASVTGSEAALASATPAIGSGRRVALVIGNSSYSAVPMLANPQRDADAFATTLRQVGFSSVTVKNNLSRTELVRALRNFEEEAERSEWAVVYYAGHGIEMEGTNYLVPIDAALKVDRDVQDEAVPLDRVLSTVQHATKLRLVILDACRDNPFASKMRRSIASRSVGRGLGDIEPQGGVLVVYSAKHGQIALDGEGQNSPFSDALVKRIVTPNLEIGMLVRIVRDDVLAATGKKQEPYIYGSLPGESMYFLQK